RKAGRKPRTTFGSPGEVTSRRERSQRNRGTGMNDTSVALTTGREGKVIPVARPTFLIGRVWKCQLRLGNIRIGRGPCALPVCDGKVFVWDLNSANGTFVNDRRVQGVVELLHRDCLRVGPLELKIHIDTRPLNQTMDEEALRLSFEKDSPLPSVED